MNTQQRKETIEEILASGMPLQLALGQIHAIFHDQHDSNLSRDEQLMWLLQCVLAQGRKDGIIEAREQAMEAIRQIHS